MKFRAKNKRKNEIVRKSKRTLMETDLVPRALVAGQTYRRFVREDAAGRMGPGLLTRQTRGS